MKIILLIAVFHAFFFSLLLIQKKNKEIHDKILIYWLVFLGIYSGVYAFFAQSLYLNHPLLFCSFISLLMFHGPFLFLYISSITSNKKKLMLFDLFHFLPVLFFNIYFLIANILNNTEGLRMDHVVTDAEPPFLFVVFLISTAISGPIYFILSIKELNKLDINILKVFSYSEKIDLDWLKKLVYVFGTVWTLLIVIATIHHIFHLFSMTFCTDGLFLSLSIFIILIGYFGLKQKIIFDEISFKEQYDTLEKKKYASSKLDEGEALQYFNKLRDFMDIEKPYLDSKLTILQLSKMTEIPSHYLSQIINEKAGVSFYDFINNYRVEEVKKKIIDSKYSSFSLLGIAYDCGFNSKSTFNRIFKKNTGLTPTQFKNQKSKTEN